MAPKSKRVGRIGVSKTGGIYESSVEHLKEGDELVVVDKDSGEELYRTKFDRKKYEEGLKKK